MGKWQMVRLVDVGTIVTGSTPKTNDMKNYDSCDINFYKPGDFKEGTITDLVVSERYISNHAKNKARILPANSVLVTCIGIIGKVGILNDVATCNQQINAIMPSIEICNKRYLAYAILHINQQINDIANAAVVPIINKSQFSNLQIPLPPLDVQQKIADVLDKASALIELRRAQLDKLDLLIKSQFIEMFGNNRYPLSPISELVDKNICSVKRQYGSNDIIHYVDISSIDNKKNIITGCTDYKLSEAPSRAQQCIQHNDILISTVRPNLKNVAINEYLEKNMVASSGFCVLRPAKCPPKYLFTLVLSDDFTNRMSEVTTGANYPAIRDSDILEYQIPIPQTELMEQFAAFVEQVDKSKFTLQQSLSKLELNYKSLMQKCFRGEMFS